MNAELLAYIQGVFSGAIAVMLFWTASNNRRNKRGNR